MSLGGILSGVGAIAGASSAKSAQKAQQAASMRQLDIQEGVYEDAKQNFAPFVQGGREFYNALRYELLGGERPMVGASAPDVVEFQDMVPGAYDPNGGVYRSQGRDSVYQPVQAPDRQVTKYRVGDQVFGERDAAQAYADANPVGGTEYQGFEATPFQNFLLQSNMDAIENSAASRGNLFSGATMKAIGERNNMLTGGFYGEYLDRLTGQAGAGQNAAGQMGVAGQNYATGASGALANYGNAGAAGAIGVGNALTGGINNALGLWGWQQAGAGGLTPGYKPPSNALMASVQRAVG